MRHQTESWSPDWLSNKIFRAEGRFLESMGRALQRWAVFKFSVIGVFMLFGLLLIQGWPQFRSDLGFGFFRSLGPLIRTGYLLPGVMGVFMVAGGIRFLLPARWLGWPFDIVCFFAAGWVLWYHANRFSLFPSPQMSLIIQVMVVILPFVLLLYWMKRSAKEVFILFISTVSIGFLSYYFYEALYHDAESLLIRNPWITALALIMCWSTFVGLFWTSLKKSLWVVITFTWVSSVGASVILWFMGTQDHSRYSKAYLTPSRYWMGFVLILLMLQLHGSRVGFFERLKLILFPSNWMGQVPFFVEQIRHSEVHPETYFRGLWDSFKVILVLAGCRLCDLYFPLDSLSIPAFGFVVYIELFLLSWLVFLMPVACARLLGYRLPDPFEFPLLAANPLDRWRRWNTYYYEWFRVTVFAPVLKKTKSPALAVALTFFFTWYIHIGSISPGYYPRSVVELLKIFFDKFLFFTLHGLAVYMAIKWPGLFPEGRSRLGWLGVLMVFVIMTFIHLFAFPNLIWEHARFMQQYRNTLIGF